MSQQSFMRSIDAQMFAAFAAAGMGSGNCIYRTRDGVETTGLTMLFDDVALVEANGTDNEGSIVAGQRREMTIQRAQVNAPAAGDFVLVDGARWRLMQRVAFDQSITRWIVASVPA
jgi:hypothetical protein